MGAARNEILFFLELREPDVFAAFPGLVECSPIDTDALEDFPWTSASAQWTPGQPSRLRTRPSLVELARRYRSLAIWVSGSSETGIEQYRLAHIEPGQPVVELADLGGQGRHCRGA